MRATSLKIAPQFVCMPMMSEMPQKHPNPEVVEFVQLIKGSTCADLIAARDWSATTLGPIAGWPQSLKTATAILLRSPVPIVMLWGEDGVMIYNDAYSIFAGARHPQLLGSKVREGWPEVADFNDNVMRVGLSGGTLHYKDQELTLYRHGRPEQVFMDLDYSSIPDESGAQAGVICILAETTERVRAESALRKMNETLEAQVAARSAERDQLWNLSQDMLARADYSGMMSAVSPAWTQVLGWTESELLSRGYATFMHPEDMPHTLDAIGQMGQSREPTRFDNRIATKDGGWKHIEWTVAPEADGFNFIAVGRDLSLAKAREAELEAAREALRQSQKMEAMGSLTGGVAHDFNNLLTPIIGSLDMLARRGVGNERERRLIDGALQSADRAKTLVQRLLAFARRQPLQPTAVDVGGLVEGMTGLLSSTLGPTIDIRVDLSSDLPAARADSNQLEMALLNLAVNARDAMPDGGVLRIAAVRESVHENHRSGIKIGHYVRLSVSDTGMGMDQATLARAVEPFFSTKGIGKGTGLGLSMVHGLVAQLGGGLAIDSDPNRGTSVQLWLPISATAADDRDNTTSASTVRIGRGVALLVDDEDLVRMSTADMLIDLGFEVIEASSADEALKLLRGGSIPDLLVTDHLMPGKSGAELAREARALKPALPVLLVSGYSEAEGIAPDLPRLAKPFRNAELAASVAAALMPQNDSKSGPL